MPPDSTLFERWSTSLPFDRTLTRDDVVFDGSDFVNTKTYFESVLSEPETVVVWDRTSDPPNREPATTGSVFISMNQAHDMQSFSPEAAGHQQAVAEVLAHQDAIDLLTAIVSDGEYSLPAHSSVEPLLRLANANLIFTADRRAFATLEALDLIEQIFPEPGSAS